MTSETKQIIKILLRALKQAITGLEALLKEKTI